eukprot:5009651-Pleurochrysis_carterae.AAC.1
MKLASAPRKLQMNWKAKRSLKAYFFVSEKEGSPEREASHTQKVGRFSMKKKRASAGRTAVSKLSTLPPSACVRS